MKTLSRILSGIFSPLLLPTYSVALAFLATALAYAPGGVRLRLLLICFAVTCIVPLIAILALKKLGAISDTGLNVREDRPVPYILVGICYGFCGIILSNAHAPSWLVAFMYAGVFAAVVNVVVNIWWKISAHLAAMGGALALVFRLASSELFLPQVSALGAVITAVILTGAVATARVYLGRHTLMQTVAGTANGFLWVWLFTAFSM